MIRTSVMGGSGYAGGELLRLLFLHPSVELQTVTSRKYEGEPLYRVHPNLRGITTKKFQKNDLSLDSITESDVVFTALPHGQSLEAVPLLLQRGVKVIDLTADFRLKNSAAYQEYYGYTHGHPELLEKAVYGLPELHKDEIKDAQLVSVPGCMATAAILALAPIVKDGWIDESKVVVDTKIGSSGAGAGTTLASHHSERSDGVRPYKVAGHRHIAEVEQELRGVGAKEIKVAFTPHAVNMVRGILSTAHVFLLKDIEARDLWKAYRSQYEDDPFIRMVSDRRGLYGLPNPKVTVGTNFCDIGFEVDAHAHRVIVMSALDNLTKGAAGQAVQCFNIMLRFDERTGLNLFGMHP